MLTLFIDSSAHITMKILFILLIYVYVSAIRSDSDIDYETVEINSASGKNKHVEIKQRTSSNSWECPEDETTKQHNLMSTHHMLKQGEIKIDSEIYETENTILVLGNIGVGKTTFVQFLAGNDRLASVEAVKDLEQFSIEDGIKIGNAVTDSFTYYPEHVAIDPNTSFTDMPGFSDAQSQQHESVAVFATKKYLQKMKNIKIVLLISYQSVLHSNNKNDFVSLLQSVNNFVKDVDYYKNSIALIATKVPNTYKIKGNMTTLIPDDKIILSIGDYISKVKDSLGDKILKCSNDIEKDSLESMIKIIESLEEIDDNGNFMKINIFRSPAEPGLLSSMQVYTDAKQSLQNTVFNKIDYSEIYSYNIGFTITPKTIVFLNCILWDLNDNIISMSSYIFKEIERHYDTKIKNNTDIFTMKADLDEVSTKLKSLKNYLKSTQNFTDFSLEIFKFISNENITINKNENDDNLMVHEYVSYLEQFTNVNRILSTLSWAEQMEPVLIRIKQKMVGHYFAIELFKYFSSYEIQNNKSVYFNLLDSTNGKHNILKKILFSSHESTFSKQFDSDYNTITPEKEKILDFNNIILFTLEEKNNITCDKNGKFLAFGNYIIISKTINNENIRNYCGSTPVRVIGLFAIHTIFIDADLDDKKLTGIDIILIAPKWEVIGSRIINIEGNPGKNHENPRADDGTRSAENGVDGMPGFPGDSGGNFIGIGMDFINDNNLVINANGGNGGPGQHGGHGQIGKRGKAGFHKDNLPLTEKPKEHWEYFFVDSIWKQKNFTKYKMELPYCSGNIETFTRDGECGTKGGKGGNGGIGGIGGNPGKVHLFGKNKIPNFSIYNFTGNSGLPGNGGTAGKIGERGKTVTCFKIKLIQEERNSRNVKFFEISSAREEIFWTCSHLMYDTPKCENDLENMNGKYNFTSNGILLPQARDLYNFSNDFEDYKLLLNVNNKFLMNQLQKFQFFLNNTALPMTNNYGNTKIQQMG